MLRCESLAFVVVSLFVSGIRSADPVGQFVVGYVNNVILNPWNFLPIGGEATGVVVGGRAYAARAGAKSAEQMAKHLDKLGQARKRVEELRRTLDTLQGPKAQNPVREQIQDLLDQIRGHEKEIRQKWPELGDGV